MKFGIFSFWENYGDNDRQAYDRQLHLVSDAEELGFDEVWLAEHHFGRFSPCPSILLLAGHLAALTTRMRIGTAAVLLPYQDPIRTAEDVATVDLLSGGRFNFGVARGGPIPLQEQHFQVVRAESRAITIERLDAIRRLLHEDRVSVTGRSMRFSDVTIYPKPVQREIPIFIASSDRDFVAHAAKQGYGFLGAQAWPVSRLQDIVAIAREANPAGPCGLTVLRPLVVAKSSSHAHRLADEGLGAFSAKMQGYVQPPVEPGQERTGPDPQQLKANAIVGDPLEVREAIRNLSAQVPLTSLVFRPAALDEAVNRMSLRLFAEQVWPFLE